jgi:hypothetical protein
MLLLTTCRDPSKNTRVFARRLGNVVPHSKYSARGKKSTDELIILARHGGFPRIALISEKNGNPCSIKFIKVTLNSWEWANEIKVVGVHSAENRQKFSEVHVKNRADFFEKVFLMESEDEAEITAETEGKDIIFKKQEETLMRIKTEGI